MAPSDRLKPVRRVAESRERDAARILGDAQRILKDQESKLEQLRLFRQEYQERFQVSARNGMGAAQLQEYQAFMVKLDQAIRQQEAVVSDSRTDRSLKRENWQQKYTRTQALGKVIDRFRSEEDRERERKEQKESDELSLRGARRRD